VLNWRPSESCSLTWSSLHSFLVSSSSSWHLVHCGASSCRAQSALHLGLELIALFRGLGKVVVCGREELFDLGNALLERGDDGVLLAGDARSIGLDVLHLLLQAVDVGVLAAKLLLQVLDLIGRSLDDFVELLHPARKLGDARIFVTSCSRSMNGRDRVLDVLSSARAVEKSFFKPFFRAFFSFLSFLLLKVATRLAAISASS
jgi:hypothetical protein